MVLNLHRNNKIYQSLIGIPTVPCLKNIGIQEPTIIAEILNPLRVKRTPI